MEKSSLNLKLEVYNYEDYKKVVNINNWPSDAFKSGIKEIIDDQFKYNLIIRGIPKNKTIEFNQKGVNDIRNKYGLCNLTRRLVYNTNEPKTKYNAEALNIEKFVECLKLKKIFIDSKYCAVDYQIYFPKQCVNFPYFFDLIINFI